MAMSPTPAVCFGQYDTIFVTLEWIVRSALVADKMWSDVLVCMLCLNQLAGTERMIRW